ncbi:putative transcription factor interactor and regulator CCHC(Zn) family [Helianthus annuus]|nr:putative transcription factor interactor and regulator CCHC(Zn) family [Helianthus annuus]KAJ0782382.1 putative transcription factor interactor and regulator CCHC(Zn) family [Helianthus annuus]
MGDTGPVTITETLISKLDASDPLYLHPSDSSSLIVVNVKLKGTENYIVWANAMKLALQVKNKMGFIDGKCVKSTQNDVLVNQWERCNYVVLTWILNSISEELYVGQVYSKLASEVWQDLKETHDKVDGSIVFSLYQKLNSVSQNGATVSEYYHKLNTMWKQFDAMIQLPSCTCQASKEFNDFNHLIKLMQFLMGLDDVYQPVRTNLLTRDPLPSVKTAFSIISREESHRGTNVVSKGQNVGFVSKSNQTFDSKKKFNRGPNPNLKCTHCNKLGHTVDRCYEIVGYPQGPKSKGDKALIRVLKQVYQIILWLIEIILLPLLLLLLLLIRSQGF